MAKRKPNLKAVKTLLHASWRGAAESFDRVWSEVIEQMLVLYFPPSDAENEADLTEQCGVALKAYVADLAEFSADTLAQGWAKARRINQGKGWPTIQVIRSACQEEAALAVSSAPLKPAKETGFKRFDQQAEAAMRTNLGQRAMREGWGWELFCHVRDGGDVPTEIRVINRLKAAPDRAANAMAGIPEAHKMHDVLRDLHHAMIRKNDWLCERFLRDNHSEAA